MFGHEIDWQVVSSVWGSINTAVQVILGGILLYTQGWGGGKFVAQVFRFVRGPQMWAAYRRWANRPTRLDTVETRLTALLVKLGEQPPPAPAGHCPTCYHRFTGDGNGRICGKCVVKLGEQPSHLKPGQF